jgi:hypothetical protein
MARLIDDRRPQQPSYSLRRAQGAILRGVKRELQVVVVSVAVLTLGATTQALARAGSPVSPKSGTVVYNERGEPLITFNGAAGQYGASGECWVSQTRTAIYAGITHTTFGGATQLGPHRWKVWVGKRLAGRIVWRSRNRWGLVRTSRENRYGVDQGPLGRIGYTIGPDGPAAGTAFLLLGVCK